MKKPINREQWLQHAAEVIRRHVKKAGVVVPPVQISCSWPGGGDSQKRIGECWRKGASKGNINELFISPKIEDSTRVIGILCHELAHAVLDCAHGHKAPFVAVAAKMGCEGNPTSMVPPVEVSQAWADKVIARHGAFPHRSVDKNKSGIKKQPTRMLKVECGDCGAIWRMAQKHIERVSSCPCCQSEDIAVEQKEG